jgi:hypothetical protein
MSSKEEEERYIRSFFRTRPDLHRAEPEPCERPDFVLSVDARRIGIEVTRFSPLVESGYPSPDEQDSLRRRTINLARQSYERAGGAPLYVHAIFSSHPPLTRQRAPELAGQIASLLQSRTQVLTVYNSVEVDYRNLRPLLPELTMLSALRVPTDEYSVWYDGEGARVQHAGAAEIARVVAGKESRIPSYREKCEELWLLIAFEFLAGSTHVEAPTDPCTFSISSNFDRVFCLASTGNRCVEIPLTAS